MRMSDIVSGLGLAVYPIIAMLMFIAVFAGAMIRVFARGRRAEMDAAANLPLADDTARPPQPSNYRDQPAPEPLS